MDLPLWKHTHTLLCKLSGCFPFGYQRLPSCSPSSCSSWYNIRITSFWLWIDSNVCQRIKKKFVFLLQQSLNPFSLLHCKIPSSDVSVITVSQSRAGVGTQVISKKQMIGFYEYLLHANIWKNVKKLLMSFSWGCGKCMLLCMLMWQEDSNRVKGRKQAGKEWRCLNKVDIDWFSL